MTLMMPDPADNNEEPSFYDDIPLEQDLQPLNYQDYDEYMGTQYRMMDEPNPDDYLDASYEDRYDIGDAYEL